MAFLKRVVDESGNLLGFFDDLKAILCEVRFCNRGTYITTGKHFSHWRQRELLRKSLLRWDLSREMRAEMIQALRKHRFIVRVEDARNEFVGFFPESLVWLRWDVLRVENKRNRIILRERLDNLRRARFVVESGNLYLDYLSERQKEHFYHAVDELTKELSTQDVEEYDLYDDPYPVNIDWIIRTALRFLAAQGRDQKVRDEIELVLQRIDRSAPNIAIARVARELSAIGSSGVVIGTRTMAPETLVEEALSGNNKAIQHMALLMADDIERSNQLPQKCMVKTEDVPGWAKSHRTYVISWAERMFEARETLKDQPATLYVAHKIKSGKADLLVFDGQLYNDVINAKLEGNATFDAEAFPYPVCIVCLSGMANVYGVAICKASDVNLYAQRYQLRGIDDVGLLTFFIGDGLGAMLVDEQVTKAADKLLTYLDCDNAETSTIYVDGAGTDGDVKGILEHKPNEQLRQGVDYVTGTRVVVERNNNWQVGRTRERCAHFRRGHYARYRIGPRNAWHYEKRWVRPTFVHGVGQAVTQHRVVRIVLGGM